MIHVIVFRPSDRKFFHAQWTDPITAKQKTKSTKTAIQRDAERFAGNLEKELNEGTYRGQSRITWSEFRKRFEDEVIPSKAPVTNGKFQAAFNAIERHIDPKLLIAINADQLSRFQKKLRDEDKLREATIKGHLAFLRIALNWAKRIGLIATVPEIDMPKRTAGMKGRPITTEEFERMLAKVPDVVLKPRKGEKPKTADRLTADAARVESWRRFLRGLWWSGLRLGEALILDWTDDRKICVDLLGRRPMFRVRAEAEKGYKDRTFPMAPEFAEMLLQTPEDDRTGFVFNPLMQLNHGKPRRPDTIGSVIVDIGIKAGVKVAERGKKIKHASAHDLRRAFGTRWSTRVMPPVLQQMMRHASIQTTMEYYVGQNAETTADAVWEAFGAKNRSTNTFTNTDHFDEKTPSGETT
jgi:integrase